MKPLEKIKLIQDIGRELQSRFTFSEIDAYFAANGIPTDHEPSVNSKHVYVTEVLPRVDDSTILSIASELEIIHSKNLNDQIIKDIDVSFWKQGYFRLFMSHLASFKERVTLLKKELEKYGITCFVAHEDIKPTREWQIEIEKGLLTMDALCAILMPGFKESNWTDQEVGVAFGRNVLIIPIRRGLDPYGFIGKFQGIQAKNKSVGQVAEFIFSTISSNEKSNSRYIEVILDLLIRSESVEAGSQWLKILKKIDSISYKKIEKLHLKVIDNQNLKNPKFISDYNKFATDNSINLIYDRNFESGTYADYDDLPF